MARQTGHLAAGDVDPRAGLLAGRARDQRDGRDRRDAGQRLAAEAKRRYRLEVASAGDLAGGKALKCQLNLVGGDAATVVDDANVLDAACPYLDGDFGRPGVKRVFRELLDHRCGPLGDLARRDLG